MSYDNTAVLQPGGLCLKNNNNKREQKHFLFETGRLGHHPHCLAVCICFPSPPGLSQQHSVRPTKYMNANINILHKPKDLVLFVVRKCFVQPLPSDAGRPDVLESGSKALCNANGLSACPWTLFSELWVQFTSASVMTLNHFLS